jgi:DNA-binding response OmpR family regulator
MHVLLIEDGNLEQARSLLTLLKEHGHHIYMANTLETAVSQAAAVWPNLVIFNPVTSSIDLAGFQRAINKTVLDLPHIIVSDRNHLDSEINKDTILIGPNKPQQLFQLIQQATAKQKERFLRSSHLVIDCQQHQVLRDSKHYAFTPKEFKLLYLLIKNQGQVLSRKTIMKTVWETDYMGDTRTLDVHIRWLREKIENNPSKPEHLLTVRGVGYRFVTEFNSE